MCDVYGHNDMAGEEGRRNMQRRPLRVPSHLGVKTPGDPGTSQPSMTHSCESSNLSGSFPGRLRTSSGRPHLRKNCTCGISTQAADATVLSPFALHRTSFCVTTGMLTTMKNCGTHGFQHYDGRQQPPQRTVLRNLPGLLHSSHQLRTCLCGITATSNTLSMN